MRIRLTLAQVTALIDAAEMSSLPIGNDGPKLELPIDSGIGEEERISPRIALAEAIVVLKTAVQKEVSATESRLNNMVKELNDHGYIQVTEELEKVRFEIKRQNSKTEDKYFDENGQIKPSTSK
jgi:hypothetical protein